MEEKRLENRAGHTGAEPGPVDSHRRLHGKHHILFQWVKGHVGTRYNELCDRLAKEEAKDHR